MSMVHEAGVLTLRDVLEGHLREAPDAPFLIAPETGRVMRYRDIAAEAVALHALLRERGLAPGDKAGFLLPNGYRTTALFLGTMLSGHVITPFNLLAQKPQLAHCLGHSDCRVVFTSAAADGSKKAGDWGSVIILGRAHSNHFVFAGLGYQPPRTSVTFSAGLGYERGYFDEVENGGKWDWTLAGEVEVRAMTLGIAYVGCNAKDDGNHQVVGTLQFHF